MKYIEWELFYAMIQLKSICGILLMDEHFFFQIKWFASKGEYVAWYCIFITGNSKYDILVGIIRTALINKLKNSKDMEFTLVHKYQ